MRPAVTDSTGRPRPLAILATAALGMHVSDQIALVAAPLVVALVFDGSATVIGLIVAGQALAQLLGSVPFGLIVDRHRSRRIVVSSTLVSIVAMTGAAFAVSTRSIVLFGVAITVAGFGIVLFSLVALSMIPAIAGPTDRPHANSRLEFPRALASFAIPVAAGVVVTASSSSWVFVVAAAGAAAALLASLHLPDIEPSATTEAHPLRRIIEGGRFVIAQPLLRAITLCSLAWNLAFAAVFVAMVPLLDAFGRDPAVFGIALGFLGLAMICGTWLIGRGSDSVAPKVVLVFGPAASVCAAMMLLASNARSPVAWYCAAFFLLGFGPSMWLVAQNTVRQVVAPRSMLGRVNALIQTAIYGSRPVGAAVAGVTIEATSPRVGLLAAAALFGMSTLAVVVTGLRSIDNYDSITPSTSPTVDPSAAPPER